MTPSPFSKSNVFTILIIDPRWYKQLSDAKQRTVYITGILNFAISELITEGSMLSSKPVNALFAFLSKLTTEMASHLKLRCLEGGIHDEPSTLLDCPGGKNSGSLFLIFPPAVWCINSLLSADALMDESLHFSRWRAAPWDSLSNLALQTSPHNVTL